MLSRHEFEKLLTATAPRLYPPDDEQSAAVFAPADDDLFIVAGPGTGKTSCLTYRALYLVFVAGLNPNQILATTFTRKAAAELRSRILGWGYRMIDAASPTRLPSSAQEWLRALDLNEIITGTLDALCEAVMREHRAAGEEPPVVADEYVTRTVMLRDGLLGTGHFRSASLDKVLLGWRGKGGTYGYNVATKAGMLANLADRRHNDLVNLGQFSRSGPIAQRKGRKRILEVLDAYDAALSAEGLDDFAQLERRFAEGLADGGYPDFSKQIRAILVDEYQDTNALQERIYFSLARTSGASITVVGDDDQSLYRFRGATVELFREFPKRVYELKRRPRRIFLTRNYRSTRRIVEFVVKFGSLDPGFQNARVAKKPPIRPRSSAAKGPPILAMFRRDAETLARDLAGFLGLIFHGKGIKIDGETIRVGKEGDVSDAALLCDTPNENDGTRLPGILRAELHRLEKPIEMYNPRGQDLAITPIVAEFGGLVLACLAPNGTRLETLKGISLEAKAKFEIWRHAARRRLARKGAKELSDYVAGWTRRKSGRGLHWPAEVPCIDLLYGLRHWFEEFQNDPEHQVHFEAFTRQLEAAEEVSGFGGRILRDPKFHKKSVEHLLRDFLAPIADGTVSINEDLMEVFPRGRLPVLSIHQSKGLEFPLVIVDIGSRFTKDHWKQRRARFPEEADLPHRLEDALRPHSKLGPPKRAAVDRAFDDLTRLYYVAFSRARDILLVVGLGTDIPNVARGWRRDGTNAWANKPPWKALDE